MFDFMIFLRKCSNYLRMSSFLNFSLLFLLYTLAANFSACYTYFFHNWIHIFVHMYFLKTSVVYYKNILINSEKSIFCFRFAANVWKDWRWSRKQKRKVAIFDINLWVQMAFHYSQNTSKISKTITKQFLSNSNHTKCWELLIKCHFQNCAYFIRNFYLSCFIERILPLYS